MRKEGNLLAFGLISIGIFLFTISLREVNTLIKFIGIIGSVVLIIVEASVLFKRGL